MHWLWLAFAGLIGLMVVIDLGLVTRRPRAVRPIEAFASFAVWVIAALGFSILVWYVYDQNMLELEPAVGPHALGASHQVDGFSAWLQFVTCYVLELALSLDNIAVLTLLLAYFKIPAPVVGRALFWTVLSSLTLRLVLVWLCATLLRDLSWFKWVLGGALGVAMLRTLLLPDESTDFNARWYVRLLRRLIPISDSFDGQRLITRQSGRIAFTPIVLVIAAAGFVDVAFASDSIPALFSVTRDPFLAFSAGAMGLLSLRSLAISLSSLVGRFRYLRLSLVFLLLTLAGKMILSDYSDRATVLTLIAIGAIVVAGIAASALHELVVARRLGRSLARPSPIEDLTEAADLARRNLRKLVVLIAGTFIVLVVAPIVGLWPGPGGLFVAAAGIALLATEFIWARRLLIRVKTTTASVARRSDTLSARTPAWLAVGLLLAYIAAVVLLAWGAPYTLPSWLGMAGSKPIGSGLILTLSVTDRLC
jgi:tellurite resistance protein TerC